jgi:EpsD family peptidyl-prolyl cis-trans isomerase
MALAQTSGAVIARVGTQEITAGELENEFRRASVPPEQRSDEVTSRILGDLVKRKYFAQRAIAVGLDRKPIIQSEIVRAREQVLATAYLQNKLAVHTDIGPREVDAFINAHPLQFGKRVLLTTDQITIALNGDTSSVINSVRRRRSLGYRSRQRCSRAPTPSSNKDANAAVHESLVGTNRTTSKVRRSVAIGGKPDMARTAQFGRK